MCDNYQLTDQLSYLQVVVKNQTKQWVIGEGLVRSCQTPSTVKAGDNFGDEH